MDEIVEKKPKSQIYKNLVIAILIIAVGFLVFRPSRSSEDASTSTGDLYFQPNDMKSLISTIRSSTVTIYCGDSAGSGWFVDLEDTADDTTDDQYPFEIVTNDHVVEQCDIGDEVKFTSPEFTAEYSAYLYNFDEEADLALLITDIDRPSLVMAPLENKPAIGHWVMAVGSPGGSVNLDGSVTTGRITNIDGYYLATDAAINFGNSGGPLVNSLGQVVGTNSWREDAAVTDNIAYAQANPTLCAVIMKCTETDTWNWQ